MNIKELLTPTPRKLVITAILPAIIGLITTLSITGIFTVYGLLLTPGYTLYADIAYYYRNYYILAWIPLYLTAGLVENYLGKR
jgi:hypothetical protein